jgi:hypothetical protein
MTSTPDAGVGATPPAVLVPVGAVEVVVELEVVVVEEELDFPGTVAP